MALVPRTATSQGSLVPQVLERVALVLEGRVLGPEVLERALEQALEQARCMELDSSLHHIRS